MKKQYTMPQMRLVTSINSLHILEGSQYETIEQYSKKRNFYNSDIDDEEEEDNSKFYVKY